MQRLLTLAAACLLSGAMAFGQSTATEPPAGAQSNPSGTASSSAQGRVARTPSARNQALPDKTNPANASSDAGTNGQAVRPNAAGSGTPGTAAGNTPNSGDNSDNNGMAKDDTGSNAAKGNSNKITNPGTAGVNSWFWMALIVILAVIFFAALLGRNRARANIDPADPAMRATRDRDDGRRRDDQIRKAS